MTRVKLINHQGHLLTPDTVGALNTLAQRLSDAGWILDLLWHEEEGWLPNSLLPAGRDIPLRVRHPSASDQDCLNALWGHAVPLGFTPLNRYPIAGRVGTAIFHYYGPWHVVLDSLLSEGRGHLAWPSLCAAAQVDVGAWQGDRTEVRFIQAQLHRLGFHCGPVDGILGSRTLEALGKAGVPMTPKAGLPGVPLGEVCSILAQMEPPRPVVSVRQLGHLALPGRELVISSTGGVKVTRTPLGASLTVDGPGQLTVTVGDRRD